MIVDRGHDGHNDHDDHDGHDGHDGHGGHYQKDLLELEIEVRSHFTSSTPLII